MSSSLYYTPTKPEPPQEGGWGMPLKTLIVRRFWDAYADGTLKYQERVVINFTRDGDWLSGVVAGSEGSLTEQSKELLEALYKHKELEIWVE